MNKRQDIEIAGKTYQIGFSFRAIKLFEESEKKSIHEISGSWDEVIYCYCSLKAINPDFRLSLDEFIDLIDADPQLFIDLQFGIKEQNEEEEEQPAAEKPKKKYQTIKMFFGLWTLSALLLVSPVLIPVTFGSIWIFASCRRLFRHTATRGSKRA